MTPTTIGCIFVLIAAAAGGRVRRWPQTGAFSYASSGGGFGAPPGVYFPPQPQFSNNPYDAFQQWMAQMQQAQAQQAQAFGQFGGFSNTVNPNPNDFAASSVNFGSNGGYGEVSTGPDGGPNGLGVRISEDFGPPQGNNFGTFSSSSISSSVDANGKRTTHKESAIGVNDNGKIYFKKTSESPSSNPK